MKAFWNNVQLRHAPQFFLQRGRVRPNFEVPARAEVLLAACRSLGLTIAGPPTDRRDALLAVHDAGYLEFLRTAAVIWDELGEAGPEMVASSHPTSEMLANGAKWPSGIVGQVGWYTADTSCPIGSSTWESAEMAAYGAVAAADEACAGHCAYALGRPPGHHAYAARAGGHCYLNNAAIAAQRLRAGGVSRVAVLDIDSHHGNGSQGIFWDRPDVLFVSVHADPNRYYPWFVGHSEETGGGAGTGCNLNIPLEFGTSDSGWLAAIDGGLAAIRRFRADALVVSLGFDPSRDEPLAALAVSRDGFARAGAAIGGLRLPSVIVQEGGYNLGVIGDLLIAFLTAFATKAP
jgi:acetoin utilization deacetylase AcuC-like enzyme